MKLADASSFHVAQGAPGSTYRTPDKKVYCRTPQGVRLMDKHYGPYVHGIQLAFERIHGQRHRVLRWAMLTALGLGGLIGFWTARIT